MLAKPPTCRGCDAEQVGVGYVPGYGPTDAEIAIVGQGPGSVEAGLAEPFVGPIGQRMRDWLAHAAINPHRVWLDNVVRCWLPANSPTSSVPGNRAPTAAEREHCKRVHLDPSLAALRELVVVVAVGMPASKSLLGNEHITEAVVGTTVRRTL